jgi:hypothetical protein
VNGTLQDDNIMKLIDESHDKADIDMDFKAIDKCKALKGIRKIGIIGKN